MIFFAFFSILAKTVSFSFFEGACPPPLRQTHRPSPRVWESRARQAGPSAKARWRGVPLPEKGSDPKATAARDGEGNRDGGGRRSRQAEACLLPSVVEGLACGL